MDAAREVGGFGNAEVGELDLAGIAEEDVRGRDVPMDDARGVALFVCRVRKVEGGRERMRNVRCEARVERLPAPAQVTQHGSEVGAFDELEGEEVRPAGHAEVEDARDVTVMQECGQTCFAKEHLDEVGVVDERGQDPLEANALLETSETPSDRDERLGHAADAEPFDQLVVAKVFGGCGGHERTKVPQLGSMGPVPRCGGRRIRIG